MRATSQSRGGQEDRGDEVDCGRRCRPRARACQSASGRPVRAHHLQRAGDAGGVGGGEARGGGGVLGGERGVRLGDGQRADLGADRAGRSAGTGAMPSSSVRR